MVSVAQKTLFVTFITILALIFCKNSLAENKVSINNKEDFIYKVSLNGINLGKAYISYQPNAQQRSYKMLITTKTVGLAKSLYNINDKIVIYGSIKDNQLVSNNHTIIINEGSHKSNKTATFNYGKDLLTIQDNKQNKTEKFVLLDKAQDIFSTMFSLRFNTDLENEKSFNFDKTVLFADKTVKNKISISKPFNYQISKDTMIKARNVVFESQRIKLKALDLPSIALINANKKTGLNFLDTSIIETEKSEKNVKVVVSSDANKTPLIIKYATKLGTFEATLVKYNN
jgi:hypothetical protein